MHERPVTVQCELCGSTLRPDGASPRHRCRRRTAPDGRGAPLRAPTCTYPRREGSASARRWMCGNGSVGRGAPGSRSSTRMRAATCSGACPTTRCCRRISRRATFVARTSPSGQPVRIGPAGWCYLVGQMRTDELFPRTRNELGPGRGPHPRLAGARRARSSWSVGAGSGAAVRPGCARRACPMARRCRSGRCASGGTGIRTPTHARATTTTARP